MALSVTNISAFTKEYAEQIALRATLGGTSLSLFGTRFDAPQIGTIKVPYAEITAIRQQINCTNSPTGTTALKQVSIVTCGLDYFTDFCPNTLRSYFPSEVMSNNPLDSNLPYEGQIVMGWADQVMADRESLAWLGQTSAGDCANGLWKTLTGDTTRNYIGTGYTSLTVTTIDDAVDAIVAALPGAVKMGNDQVYIFLSNTNFFLYQSAMVNAFGALAVANAPQPNANGSVYTMPYLKLPKIKLVAVQGLEGTSHIIAGASKNFILVGGSPSETPFKSGLDQYEKKVWLDFETIQGVGYYFGDQIATNF